jgi:iron complex transport system permease protein
MKAVNSSKSATVLIYGLCLCFFAAAFLLSVSVGSISISLDETLRILMKRILGLGTVEGISESNITIIEAVRMPRALLAAMVGGALSISGAAMQGLLKNPLADGSTLGVSSGGALGAVLFLVSGLRLPFVQDLGLTLTSILFSFLSLLLILGLSYSIDYHLATHTIILTGVIFSMLTGSLTSMLVSLSGDSLKQVVFWSMGSFSGKGWHHVLIMLPFFVGGSLILTCLSRELNAFALGEEQARYVGVNTRRVKLVILILIALLIGVSVSLSGTIGFVGLVIPHMTRMIVGPNHARLLPASLFLGGTFLMLADLASRTLFSPAEFPIGVVTSFIGGILFIYLFYSRRNKRGGDEHA